MAASLQKRMTDLSGIYNDVCTSSGTFGNFLRSKLTKDVLKKCNLTAVDLRYSTLPKETKLYSFSDHWEHATAVHVYSTRLDDPVMLPMRDKNKMSADDTSCARMFVTNKPIRILSVQQSPFLELCKKWAAAGHHESENSTSNGATNGDEGTPLSEAPRRDAFTRKNGLTLLDYTLFQERIDGFHLIEGVAYEEAPPQQPNPSRQIALFSAESLLLQQEFVYPTKKKLHKSDNGFMCCNVEPSRPQAPPMKRGKSVNTPPLSTHSPGGKPLNIPPLPPNSPAGVPPPPPPQTPPPYQPKTTPQPTPRPRTPTMPDEKGDGKGASKPPLPASRSTPKDTGAVSNDEIPKDDETDTKM